MSAVMGLLVFMLVDGLGAYLDNIASNTAAMGARGGLARLYLEVLDASFSFDGVIGAFALTTNILLIYIGLGIGAMYVRSMTIMLVEREHWQSFLFGTWGVLFDLCAVYYYVPNPFHVPEILTGGIGIVLIGLASTNLFNITKQMPHPTAAEHSNDRRVSKKAPLIHAVTQQKHVKLCAISLMISRQVATQKRWNMLQNSTIMTVKSS